jgi:hypothetical protein
MFPVRYELDFYIPEDDSSYSPPPRENLKSYIILAGWALQWRRHLFRVRYEVGFYMPKDGILHSHRHVNLKTYKALTAWGL